MNRIVITQKITSVETDSFKKYLKDISDIAMFTNEEELDCALLAQKGDKAAIDELVRRNLRFVVSVAKQYVTKDLLLEDLVNEGNYGLVLAANKFQPDKGFKFISYAVWWIRKSILEHITNNGKLVRFPVNKVSTLASLEGQIGGLEQKLNRIPDLYEVIDHLGGKMTHDEKVLLESMYTFNVDSLNREVEGGEGSTTPLYEMIADDTVNKTDYLVTEPESGRELRYMISKLKPRDQKVIAMLYGLDGQAPMGFKEIGEEIGVTREMVRQIKEKCLKMFRERLKVTAN